VFSEWKVQEGIVFKSPPRGGGIAIETISTIPPMHRSGVPQKLRRGIGIPVEATTKSNPPVVPVLGLDFNPVFDFTYIL
jgi:hypothetical protein